MRKLKIALLCGALACASPAPLFAQSAQAGISPCAAESLSVSGTSSNVALSACGPVVILYNISSTEAFYNFGTSSSATATTSNYSLPGNTYVVLNLPMGAGATTGYLAAITASSTTTIRIVQGYANS